MTYRIGGNVKNVGTAAVVIIVNPAQGVYVAMSTLVYGGDEVRKVRANAGFASTAE